LFDPSAGHFFNPKWGLPDLATRFNAVEGSRLWANLAGVPSPIEAHRLKSGLLKA